MNEFDVFDEDPEEVVVWEGPACRVCGCTPEQACPGGCIWAEPDLCSRCVDR